MRWPWISVIMAILVAVTPLGRELIHDALFSGEALSRSISEFLLYIGLAIFALIALAEWLIRLIISKRRARGTTT